MTDTDGVAAVQFRTSGAAGAAVISASVPGTSAASSRPVTVSGDGKAETLIPVLATIAAIGVAAIVVVSRREDRLPIKGSGPTQIIP